MNYRKIFKSLRPISYFNIINYYIPLITTKLNSLFSFKIKNVLRNSYSTNILLGKFFGKNIIFERLSSSFFNNRIFAYVNPNKKEEILSSLNNNCINDVNQYLEIADQVIEKKFSIFKKDVQFKDKIDWFYGFDDSYQWSLKESERLDIRPLYGDHYVDVKYVWELNRHQFLPYLGFAYYFTGDEKYSKAFVEIIQDWIERNPPLYGINWISGLEISIRLVSWIFSLYFFRDSNLINNKQFFLKIINTMAQHAYFLRYFYTRRSFNHTIGDIFGVYLFSRIFDAYPRLKRWEKKFSKLLKKQVILQVRPDGVNIEQSINYHKFVLEFFSLFLLANPELKKEKEWKIIEKMFKYLRFSIKPDGRFPLIGDNDDGKVVLLTMKANQNCFDLLTLGASLFESSELIFMTEKRSPVMILLLGLSNKFEQINASEPKSKCKYFKDSGYIVARSSWQENANYIFIDFGRFGPQHAPHSHSDVTNIIYSYKGKEILVDSGVFTYNRSWKERNAFRNSQAHNVVVIDGQCQAPATNWFGWDSKPKLKRNFRIDNTKISASCIHDGYKGFLVERDININEDVDEILIQDKITKIYKSSIKNKYDIDLYFHFAKSLDLQINQNSLEIERELVLNMEASEDFTLTLEKSYIAPGYGQKYENQRLNVHIEYDFDRQNTLEIKSRLGAKKS